LDHHILKEILKHFLNPNIPYSINLTEGSKMKKLFVFLSVAVLIAESCSPLFAGGIDNKTNWSADYIRTLNRNAATDHADIVAYNPAGTIKMGNGLYANLSVQYIDKKYTNNTNAADLESREESWVPGFFALYKEDRWSAYGAFTIVGGGGYVNFSDGNYTTTLAGQGLITGANARLAANLVPSSFWYTGIKSQRIEAESYYHGFTIGGAYKITDVFSVSLGARYTDAQTEAKGNVTINASNPFPVPGVNDDVAASVDYETEADGWCGIIGLNIAPSDKLNIGMRYDSKTKLDFEQKVNQDNLGILPRLGVNNGASVRRDLPAIFGIGLSYKFVPKIRVEANFTLYFNEDANWNGDEDVVDNGYDIGIALEYTFNDELKGSIGYIHTDTGIDAKDMLPESPELNANTIGGGVAYQFRSIPNMTLTLGVGNAFYEKESFVDSIGNTVEYKKNNLFIAFGAEYKFM
jgi:long-chain fatty acid transport protein